MTDNRHLIQRFIISIIVALGSFLSAILLPVISSCIFDGRMLVNPIWSSIYGMGFYFFGLFVDLRLSRSALFFGGIVWPILTLLLLYFLCWRVTRNTIPRKIVIVCFVISIFVNLSVSSLKAGYLEKLPLYHDLFRFVY